MTLLAHLTIDRAFVPSILDPLTVWALFESLCRSVGSCHLQDHWTDVKPGDCGNVRALRSELWIVILGPEVPGARPDVACGPSRASGCSKFSLLHA